MTFNMAWLKADLKPCPRSWASMVMKLFIIFVFLLISIKTAFSYEVSCEGYDSDTGEYVYGTCSNGSFDGYDSDTGVYVHGTCRRGGSLDAFNSDTGEYVYGSCQRN